MSIWAGIFAPRAFQAGRRPARDLSRLRQSAVTKRLEILGASIPVRLSGEILLLIAW